MSRKSALEVLDVPDVRIQGNLKCAVWHEPEEKSFSLVVPETYEYLALDDARLCTSPKRCEDIYRAAGIDFFSYAQAGIGQVEVPGSFQYNYHLQQAVAPDSSEEPEIEIPRLIPFSGTGLSLPLGEGMLDFLYADFDRALGQVMAEDEPGGTFHSENDKEQLLYDGLCLARSVKMLAPVLSASVYTMAFPPLMEKRTEKELSAYMTYLKALQKKLADLLEFVYDRDFYPKVLGNLSENERFAYYCRLIKCPTRYERRYYIDYPYFAQYPENPRAMMWKLFNKETSFEPEVQEFFERFHTWESERIYTPLGLLFPIEAFECDTIEELLMFEFWEMMKSKTQLRRCKRCGRFFIMKGNYDTNYCDRIPEGETRNCQQLAAQDNYKKKMADNAAIPLYQKYYKRYAARLRVKQIKPDQFKKWKLEAMTKRDACSDGKITVEEYENWLEGCFPNRKKRK